MPDSAQNSTKIVVLISGNGSNLQTLIDHTLNGRIHGQIVAVISNHSDAYGLERAAKAGIETQVLSHTLFTDRTCFDSALSELIEGYSPQFIVLAGFMRILSKGFVDKYVGKLINIHPSLLPDYPGLNTHQRVLDAGEICHGASVHFVIPELDAGPVIVQGKLKVGDTTEADQLAARVLQIEHEIYPLAIEWLAGQRIMYSRDGVKKDGELLPPKGYQIKYDY